MRAVIMGVGNLLLADEGVGVRVVQEIERRYELPPEVNIIDGGISGMEMLDELCGLAHLVIVDAVSAGGPAGSILRLVDDEVPRFFATRLSPHQIGLSDLLAALLIMGERPRRITLFGVEPVSVELGMELTPPVQALLPQLVDLVRAELDQQGLTLRERAHR